MNLKTGFKKKLYKFRYLEQEFLEYEELDNEGRGAFMTDLREAHSKLNVYDEALDEPYEKSNKKNAPEKGDCKNNKGEAPTSSSVEPAPKITHDAEMKKVYRKIAMKLHPDKLSKNLSDEEKKPFIEKFEKITEDYNNGDYSSLLIALDELNIIMDNYKPAWLDIIDKKILDLAQKIDVLKKSVYAAYARANDSEKKKLLSAFMKERGWTSNLAGVKKSRKENSHPGKSLSWARKLGEDN